MIKQNLVFRLVTFFILLAFVIAPFSAKPVATSSATQPGSSRAALERPHMMPPHPTIMEQVRQGNVTLPEYMLNPAKAAQEGIDQPNPRMTAGPTGTWKAIALLVKFSDKNSTVTASFFDTLLFGTSFRQMNNYYDAVSYGQLDIVTVNLPSSIGWKSMPQTYAYYVDNNYCTDGTYPHNCRKLAEDAVAAANSVVDFSQYDNDGDGYVDTVFVIHAGRGAEVTGNSTDVWSHSWWTYNEPVLDGVKIGSYTTEPEYWYSVSPSTSDMTIGVYAHELGHALGLPDLYDYDNSSAGLGDWSLMAGGSWNGTNGNSPSFLDAWSRAQLGWVTPINVSGLLSGASIRNAETYQDVYKLKSTLLGTNEYFLVENRQKTGYDAGLPGAGLLIWHIDEAKISLQQPNNVECENHNNWVCGTNHPLVALEQADGLMDLEKNNDQGDTGDPFPTASNNKRTFNSGSTPNTSSYYYTVSADTHLYVINISNSGATMTADLYVEGGSPPSAFNKLAPTNNATFVVPNPSLSWTASTGATSYEYCIDKVNDSACTSPAVWTNAGNVTLFHLSGLEFNTAYYWQVRAKNGGGTTDATGGWWKFTTMTARKLHLPLILKSASSPVTSIVNGDFEQGSGVGWQEYSSHGWDLIMNSDFPTGVAPHGGSWAVWLGGEYDDVSYIYQQVTVSSGNSYLHLWYWIASADICNYDYGYVRINSSNVHTWNLCSANDTDGWVELSLNLSAYAGQTVTLMIRAETDSSDNSNLFIDDVAFDSSAALPAGEPADSPFSDPASAALPKSEVIEKR